MYVAFTDLLNKFSPIFSKYTQHGKDGKIGVIKKKKEGRPRTVDANACLGLVLCWTRTRGAVWSTALKFGLTGACACRWLRYGIWCLLDVLRKHRDGRVKLPKTHEVEEFATLIGARHPLLGEEKVWGSMDGVKLFIQKTRDEKEQKNITAAGKNIIM